MFHALEMKQALINAHKDLPAILNHNEDIVVPCSGTSNHSISENYRLDNPFNFTGSISGEYRGVWGGAEVFNGSVWNQICNDALQWKCRSFLQFSWSSIVSFLYLKFRDIDYFQRRR
jgi:hypothetical protein